MGLVLVGFGMVFQHAPMEGMALMEDDWSELMDIASTR